MQKTKSTKASLATKEIQTWKEFLLLVFPFIFSTLVLYPLIPLYSYFIEQIIWYFGEPSYMNCVVHGMAGQPEERRGFVTYKCQDALLEPWLLVLIPLLSLAIILIISYCLIRLLKLKNEQRAWFFVGAGVVLTVLYIFFGHLLPYPLYWF